MDKKAAMILAAALAMLTMAARVATALAAESTSAGCIGPHFTAALAFGDSTTDTGNDIIYNATVFGNAARLPYGETFFRRPTGRYSNGRLIVDYVMAALGQPFLVPHLAGGKAAGTHRNFAFSGATALTLAEIADVTGPASVDGVYAPVNLALELEWFEGALNDGDALRGVDLNKTVVFFGEMGGNDYNYALAHGGDITSDGIFSLVGPVVKRLEEALNRLLMAGVRHVMMVGQFPQGCLPVFRHPFLDSGAALDQRTCVSNINAISQAHTDGVRRLVATASAAFPDANIVFLDAMAAYLHVLDHAEDFGITNKFDACDGKDSFIVGGGDSGVCSNPQNYLSWDGIHMTDTMYGALFSLFNSGPEFAVPFPNFLSACASAAAA